MLRSSAFGSGKTPSSAWPLRLMRFAGMKLPENGWTVSGWGTTIRRQLVPCGCEQSPARATAASVFGAVVVQLHLHFADRVEVDRAAEHLRAAEVVAHHAVDRHGVPGRAVAVDVRRRRSEVAARGIGRRLVRDARQHA